ncbi:MAG: hypothetical protein PSU94_12060 [Lacunisphaera sp.]|nr:hypothetical protein [Lacunisphaera sp.]
MKISALILCLAALCLASCIGPGYAKYSPDDAANHTVFALDVSYLADSTKGECFDVASLNEISLDKFVDRRIERTSDGKLAKVFVLISPGRYNAVLRYTRNAMYIAGRDFWSASVSKEVSLAAGIYTVQGKVDGDFVYLWLADSSGHQVTEPEKAQIKKSPRTIHVIIPIPV